VTARAHQPAERAPRRGSIRAQETPLARALARLDRVLAGEAKRVRAAGALALDELRGLYVSDERVDRVLARAGAAECAPPGRDGCDAPSAPLDAVPAWRALAATIARSRFERDVTLLALAREARADYEPVLGYLNDDLTRPWATRALALRLFARGDALGDERASLADAAPLLASGVLRLVEPETPARRDRSAWLAAGLTPGPVAAAILLGCARPEAYLPPWVRHVVPRVDAPAPPSAAPCPLTVVEGRPGSGRARRAAALAAARRVALLRLDLRLAPDDARERDEGVRAALLWQRLLGAVILVEGAAAMWERDGAPAAWAHALIRRLAASAGPSVLSVDAGARWRELLGTARAAHVEIPGLPIPGRADAWRRAVGEVAPSLALSDDAALALADRFDLTPGHIARVARRAADAGALDGGAGSPPSDALFAAARAESRDALGALAVRAPTPHAWGDLVLPAPTLARLRDFADAIRDRAIVLDAWGFARRAVRARGLTALFAGASGTGKTMAAAVVARELGLDLYVIDLSAVVSKYIGETEKNLERVFRAARDAGAMLFFDEADALFGKRSEVKDAHDRYANIEVAYLLQQMDAHDGVVILATNLSRNLDQAFSRRLRYVVEFPLPGEADRERLWRGIFPPEAPLDPDVDFPFLAARFPLAGGDIRNVALDAAFFAARDASDGEGSTIAMRHLVRAMARQLVKQGRAPSAADFAHHVGLLASEP
jgi:hypothetical protein